MKIFRRNKDFGKWFKCDCKNCKKEFKADKTIIFKYEWNEEWEFCFNCYKDLYKNTSLFNKELIKD